MNLSFAIYINKSKIKYILCTHVDPLVLQARIPNL